MYRSRLISLIGDFASVDLYCISLELSMSLLQICPQRNGAQFVEGEENFFQQEYRIYVEKRNSLSFTSHAQYSSEKLVNETCYVRTVKANTDLFNLIKCSLKN